MDIPDLSNMVIEAYEDNDVNRSIELLLSAFWETTENLDEMIGFATEVAADLRATNHVAEAAFCESLTTSLTARKELDEKIKAKWFIAEILRITKWVKVPSPERYAAEYLACLDRKAAVAAALLQTLPGILARRQGRRVAQLRAQRQEEKRDAAWGLARKAGLIALAPLTGGASLLHLALED